MKTALVTGGAKRIGSEIVKILHKNNFNVIIHYFNSKDLALKLAKELNTKRKNSASTIKLELSDINAIKKFSKTINKLDLIVNNASVFYPTKIDDIDKDTYKDIIDVNLTAPFFISVFLAPILKKTKGVIINIIDIHSERPLKNYPIYNISKSALAMMTKTLALELAPDIRVCGVSPGSIVWPQKITNQEKNNILKKIALGAQGNLQDIAYAVLFLATAKYITGQIINVDGGRTLNQ